MSSSAAGRGRGDSERGGGSKKEDKGESSAPAGSEWGCEKPNEAGKRLLKSLRNEESNKEKKGMKEGRSKIKREQGRMSPVDETKTWGWMGRGSDKRRQSSRFERSMRVLEWLDADCGTRLARHYEEAGGWRSLPQRRLRHQPSQRGHRQGLRCTRSQLVLSSDHSQEYDNDSEDFSSSDEEEKKVLEDSEDFLDQVDVEDEDDLVLALRRWKEEQVLQEESYEEISMKEYVTSSDDDDKDEQGDSEDELVSALQAWKEEQLRQEKLQQQLQLHRQNSLAQQPPALPPVLEDSVSSPTHEAFGYFYQDQDSLLYQHSSQRQKNNPQYSGVTPYWWGGISSVREGPSSPPILVSQSQSGKSSYAVFPHRTDTSSRPISVTYTQTSSDHEVGGKVLSHFLGSLPSVTLTTAASAANQGSLPSLNTPLQPPSSPFLFSSQLSSPGINGSSWSLHRSPGDAALLDAKSGFVKFSPSSFKSDIGASSPRSPLPRTPFANKPSSGGFGVFSNWLGAASSEKYNFTANGISDVGVDSGHGESFSDKYIHHRLVCNTLSTASSDSGIEKSPGYLSPAPRSAGIEKIGDFFRRFHHKLSPSSPKTTPPPTPGKLPTQEQLPQKHSPRRLSLSTPSIPSSSLLKPSLPVAKVVAGHARCTFTKSDPLATGAVPKRQKNEWVSGQQGKVPTQIGLVATSASRHLRGNTNAIISRSCTAGEGATVVGSSGQNDRLTTDSGAAASGGVTPSDRKGDSNIDILSTGGVCGSALTNSSGSSLGKVVTGKESLPFFVPQNYQHFHYTQSLNLHQPLSAKRSTGDIGRKTIVQDCHSVTFSDLSGLSGSQYLSRDNLNSLKKSTEELDADNKAKSSTLFTSSEDGLGFCKITKAASQIIRKSPVGDLEQVGHPDSVERDTGKAGTLSYTPGGGGSCLVDGSLVSGGSGNVKSATDVKTKDVSEKEDKMCSEVSSSVTCDEREAISVPGAVQDRGRRGSHGTCNYLFLEQASGRKSPQPPKGRKSPSPIRGILFKSAAQSTSTSSSSSADSASKYHHQAVNRVQSLPSPSSPPPHQQKTPKTSPKHLANVANTCTDSPTKKIISDSPPANYHGRRKFSDTGLTPVPKRLFSEGRRGSLTDEKTLVFAKTKLGKLRNQGRKSSTGSVAVLVKQIHNLWEEKDDEDEEITPGRRGSVGGLPPCSLDDQILFDKKRKRFSLSLGKSKNDSKEGVFGLESRKLCKKISHSSEVSGYIAQTSSSLAGSVSNLSGDGKIKKKVTEKGVHQPLATSNTCTTTSSNVVAKDEVNSPSEDVALAKDTLAGDNTNSVAALGGLPSSGPISALGSGFVAPVAHVASRQLVATAVSSAACFVGMDPKESLINRRTHGASLTNLAGTNTGSLVTKTGKKTATVQFQPIVSWDDNIVGGKMSPALRSVLKNGARRHSSFAGFSESSDSISLSSNEPLDNLSSVLNKQSKNGLPKSKTSENYKGILKQPDQTALANIDKISSSPADKRKTKSPSPKSKKPEEAPETKSTEGTLSLCLKASRSVSPKPKKTREGKDFHETAQDAQMTSSDHEHMNNTENDWQDHHTKTVGIQATPRTVGKTTNTGTQTTDLPPGEDFNTEYPGFPEGGWLQRLAAKCMASVGGPTRPGISGPVSGGLPRAASVRAEWLMSSKRMGSGPSSPSSNTDSSERFWVPHEVIARKRAQSLIPTLSKSEDDLSSEAVTPASASHPRDLAFVFPVDKMAASGVPPDAQPSTPTSGYNLTRRRASMHDAIDLNKIDTRLYDKKLIRQDSVSSLEEESQGTIHISLEHNSETNILTVNLVRAHNLVPRDPDGTANPYIRLTLLPGQRASAQCRIHRKTLNPRFEEEFIFEVSAEEVATTTLELSLYEYDQFSTDECVGYLRIFLGDHDLSSKVDLWRSFSPCDKPKDKDLGDVMFSISYLPSAERLTVVIVRARNLRLQDETKSELNPFIKVSLISGNKKIKKKKTSAAHGSSCPTWNEALVFSVHREKLQQVGMEVSAYHDNKLGSDECIGRIVLPADSEEGINCQELLNEGSMPAKWYNLR